VEQNPWRLLSISLIGFFFFFFDGCKGAPLLSVVSDVVPVPAVVVDVAAADVAAAAAPTMLGFAEPDKSGGRMGGMSTFSGQLPSFDRSPVNLHPTCAPQLLQYTGSQL